MGDHNQSEVPTTPTSFKAAVGEQQSGAEKKIEIFLKNTGNAPVIKDNKTKWLVRASAKVSDISKLVVKILKLDPSQSIFIYVNQSFAPTLDQTVQNLFDCYECDKKLVLYYATTQAWG